MIYAAVALVAVAVFGYLIYRSKKIKASNTTADFKAAAEFTEARECDKAQKAEEAVKIALAVEPKVSESVVEQPKVLETKKKVVKKATKKDTDLLAEITTTPKKKIVKKSRTKKVVG